MSFPKIIGLLGVLACAHCLAAPTSPAYESVTMARATAYALSASVTNEAPPGMAALYYVHVTVGQHELAFVQPNGYRVSAYPDKILLVSADAASSFTVRVIQPAVPVGIQIKPNFFRELVISSFPGAIILSESAARMADHSGPAFDLQWRNPGGGMQSIRIAYIPSPAGVLEICHITVPGQFAAEQFYYRMLLDSLRTNEKGQLEPATLPGNS